MATALIKPTSKDENLETYCLIWLDADVNSRDENVQAQGQLRSSINHLLPFENEQQCLEHIRSIPKDDRIVLIVSGRLGQTIVPKIVQLQQMRSIYVYCREKKFHEQWAKQFPKVKGVHVKLDELIRQIKNDQAQQQHKKADEALAINIFNSNVNEEGQTSTGLSGQFIHSQLLIDCLIRMKPSSDERKELISFCKEQYSTNPSELKIVEEFERDYSSDRSFWWYTRQSFMYRLMNKALRVQNIDLLYLFRFFIRDLGQELEKNKCSSPVHVYRAQQMSKEEIKILQKSIGDYISINSFFSTSVSRQRAQSFLFSTDRSDDVGEVFFKIDADPRLENIKPFSNITKRSYYPQEEEVLFMIGSIFRLTEIQRDDIGIWNIRMVLCSDNDHKLQALFKHMKGKHGGDTTSLLKFGHVLRDMGKLDDAEKYFHRYLDQLPSNHPKMSSAYYALGMITDDKGDYESSLRYYKKSLEIDIQNKELDQLKTANIYNSIGEVCRKKGDYSHALEAYKRALEIWRKIYGEDSLNVAMCLNNIGIVHENEKRYLKALASYKGALFIWEKHLPPNHHDLGLSHNNIGSLYETVGHYDQALEHLNLSLKIKLKSLPPQHPSIAMTFTNMGLTYEKKGDFQQAQVYLDKAANIFRHALPPTHPNLVNVEKHLKRVQSKTK